jgi:hypothetical protein
METRRGKGKLPVITYVNLHLFVKAIVHHQAVSHPDAMRLHGMSGNVGIVANVRVIEVCDSFLVHGSIQDRKIQRSCGRHGGGSRVAGSGELVLFRTCNIRESSDQFR